MGETSGGLKEGYSKIKIFLNKDKNMTRLLIVFVVVFALGGITKGNMFLSASNFKLCRSEERRVGKECRSRWSPYH